MSINNNRATDNAYWHEIAERYFEAETSQAEEQALRRFLASDRAGDDFDDVRAVMGYATVGSRLAGKSTKRRSRSRRLIVAAAASVAVVIGVGIGVMKTMSPAPEPEHCVAYINGERCTDREVVMSKMRATLAEVSVDDNITSTVSSQLAEMLDTSDL